MSNSTQNRNFVLEYPGMSKKKIVILYGAPGAGKDTQSAQIAAKFNLFSLSSSKLIEEKIFNPALQADLIIEREKQLFEAGKLCTPSWVTEIINEKVAQLSVEERGIIFSGSPRTMYEAENEIPKWEELYGKENINVLEIKIKPETSIFRNSHRRMCADCRFPIIYSAETEKITTCPKCGGPLVYRGSLDEEETIKVRLKEYEERTLPILNYLSERGYEIMKIDGEPLPPEVTKEIFQKLDPLMK